MKKISIHDIAKEMKVSSATISYVLNGKAEEKKISTKMRDKILAYASEIGYRPSLIAQGLRTGKTKLIAVLVESIADPFFADICRRIEEYAFKEGYKVFYSSTENDTERTKNLIDIFLNLNVDGFMIVPPEGIEEEINKFIVQGYPLVLLDRYYPGIKTTNVVVDNYGGAAVAVARMVSDKRKRIGFITLDSEQTQMRDRLNGYKDKLSEYGADTFVQRIKFHEEEELMVAAMSHFIRSHSLDGLLFGTNYLTANGLKAIKQNGLSIPQDISLVSFDDHPFYSLLAAPVTAVAQPIQEIASAACQRLIAAIDGEQLPAETITVPVHLIIRESA